MVIDNIISEIAKKYREAKTMEERLEADLLFIDYIEIKVSTPSTQNYKYELYTRLKYK